MTGGILIYKGRALSALFIEIMLKKIIAAVSFSSLVPFGIAFAGQDKIVVCHVTDSESNPYVVIAIADAAFPTHEAHGDFALPESGDCSDTGGGGDPGGGN